MLALVRAAIGSDRRLPIIVAARGAEAITDFLAPDCRFHSRRGQKSDVRRQKSAVTGTDSEIGGQMSEIRM